MESKETTTAFQRCRAPAGRVNSKRKGCIWGFNNQEDADAEYPKLRYTEPDLRSGAGFIDFMAPSKAVWGSSHSKVLRIV
jgi:hypothetical protein